MNVPRPHHHNPITYAAHGSVTERSFQAMLAVWYTVADILRTKPAGTVIRYQQGHLLMGDLDGELFMFESMELNTDSDATDFSMFRPDDFNGIDEHEFDRVKKDLETALKSGLEFNSKAPELVAKAISQNYMKPSVENWVWDGVPGQT